MTALPATLHLACKTDDARKDAPPFTTFRIAVGNAESETTGRYLYRSFSAPAPRFGTDDAECAEFPCFETALRISLKLEEAMNRRLRAMRLPPACNLVITESKWQGQSFDWWNALQRMDRTSIETGRYEATLLPAFMRGKS